MEALVPAFVIALLAQVGDRPAWLTAILADRFRRPLTVALAAGLAHALGNALAAGGGMLMATMLTPNAQSLLLALALLFAGAGGLWPVRPPDRYDRWRLGAFATPLVALFILALGDRTQFATFALAVGGSGAFAATGAGIGSLVIALAAAFAGETAWARLPLAPLRIAGGALMLVAGLVIGAGALRLV